MRRRSCRPDRGQATAEFAILIPVVVLLGLALIQVLVLVRSELLLIDACRSAARSLIVDPEEPESALAGRLDQGLGGLRVTVTGAHEQGELVTVTCAREDPTDVPIVGPLLPTITQRERFVAMVEGPSGYEAAAG